MTENHDLQAMAANPHTDWDVLHWIAENHPELRPVIAANPGAYQELVDALGALADPEIDAAIAQREAAGGVSTPPEPGPALESEPEPGSEPQADSPLAGLWDTGSFGLAEPVESAEPVPDDELPAASAEKPEPAQPDAVEEPAQPDAVEEPAQPEAEVAANGGDDYTEAELAAYEPPYEPHPVAAPALESPPQFEEPAFPAERPDPEGEATPEPKGRFRDSAWVPVIASVGGFLAAAGVVALLIMTIGGNDDTPTAVSPTESEPTETAPEGDDDEDPAEEEPAEEEPQVDEEAIDEARAAVAELAENPSCEIDDDAGVVAGFLTAAGAGEGFPGDEDASLLESTFEELQSECSSTHAAGVFESARSGSNAPEDGLGDTLTTVGTDWADREVDLRGAEVMAGFSAQGGNVECEFEDGLTCTVYDTNPELCDEGSTYRMTVEGVDLDCDSHLDPGDRETLPEDDSATDGFLVCTEMSDRISCYNSLDPFGFEASSTGNYSY